MILGKGKRKGKGRGEKLRLGLGFVVNRGLVGWGLLLGEFVGFWFALLVGFGLFHVYKRVFCFVKNRFTFASHGAWLTEKLYVAWMGWMSWQSGWRKMPMGQKVKP